VLIQPDQPDPVVVSYAGIPPEAFVQEGRVNPGVLEETQDGGHSRQRREGYINCEHGVVRGCASSWADWIPCRKEANGSGEVDQLVGGDFENPALPPGTWLKVGEPTDAGEACLPRLPGWQAQGYVVLVEKTNAAWGGFEAAIGKQYLGIRGTDQPPDRPSGISQTVRGHTVNGFFSLQFNFTKRVQDARRPRLRVTIAGEEHEFDLGLHSPGELHHEEIGYQASPSGEVEVKIENIGDGTVFVDGIRIQSDENYLRVFYRSGFIRVLSWQLMLSMLTGTDLYNNVTFLRDWEESRSFFWAALISNVLQLLVSFELAVWEMKRMPAEACLFQRMGDQGQGARRRSWDGACSALTLWWDWWATLWAHTLCFFLGVPHLLKDVVVWMHPMMKSMGKISAKILCARIFGCTWPSKVHFTCDNEFGSHTLLPWKLISKLFVLLLQFTIWRERVATYGWANANGTEQLVMKVVVVVWSAQRLYSVAKSRRMLAETMTRNLRESNIPGVTVDPPHSRLGTWLQPALWIAAMAGGGSECLRERCKQVDAIVSGIFLKHFCQMDPAAWARAGELRVESYTGKWAYCKSLWGPHWSLTVLRVLLMGALLAVFYQHILLHPLWRPTPQLVSSAVAPRVAEAALTHLFV